MAEKPTHLNGACYGPSVPPPKRFSRHKAVDDEGCGCLLSFLFNLILVAGLAVLVFWLIFHPNKVKFHVTDASLTQFDLNTNDTTTLLYYNLAVDITVRNPNKKIGIYYDSIEAGAYFEDQRFGSATLTPFYQGHKNTTVLSPVFKGQQVVLLGADELSKLINSEKSGAGVFYIEVKLYLGIRFKVATVNTWRVKPKIKCELKVPLSSNGTSPGAFETTECHIDFDF